MIPLDISIHDKTPSSSPTNFHPLLPTSLPRLFVKTMRRILKPIWFSCIRLERFLIVSNLVIFSFQLAVVK